MAARSYGQYCGITTAVERLTERWSLLIIRDLLVGPRRYTDLKRGLPKIPTNILSARLKELQEGGVVRRVARARCGLVYELTEYGHELEPIVLALGRWGFRSMDDPAEDDIVTADSLTMALRAAFTPQASASLDVQIQVDDVELRAQVRDGELKVVQIAPPRPPVGGSLPSGDPDLHFATAGPAIRRLIAGTLTPAQALDQDEVTIQKGNLKLLRRFTQLFRIDT